MRKEALTLRAQVVAPRHQILELVSAIQHTLDRLVQHDRRLIELVLHLHDRVCRLRILVQREELLRVGKHDARWIGVRSLRHLLREKFEDLREQRERGRDGVLLVRDDHRC